MGFAHYSRKPALGGRVFPGGCFPLAGLRPGLSQKGRQALDWALRVNAVGVFPSPGMCPVIGVSAPGSLNRTHQALAWVLRVNGVSFFGQRASR